MRFITQYPGYVAQIRPQRQRSLGDGSVEITQEPIYARFKPYYGGAFIFENELAQALKQFDFHGNTQEQDQATPTDPLQRLALFDSDEAAQEENWLPEVQAEVEQKLVGMAEFSPNDLFVVLTTPIQAPFPRYDSFEGDAEQLAVKLSEDGFDLAQVLHYERTFGRKREDVIAALEEMIELEQEQIVSA